MEDHRAYLQQHHLAEFLDESIAEIIKTHPEDPLQVIQQRIIAEHKKKKGVDSTPPLKLYDSKKDPELFKVDLKIFDTMLNRYLSTNPKACQEFWMKVRNVLVNGVEALRSGMKQKETEDGNFLTPTPIQSFDPRAFVPIKELDAINTLEFAHLLRMDVGEVLTELLQGTANGIFTMRWAITCSRCSSTISRVSNLLDIPSEDVQCDICLNIMAPNRLEHLDVYFFFHNEIFYYPTLAAKCVRAPPVAKKEFLTVPCAPSDTPYKINFQVEKGQYVTNCPLCKTWIDWDVQENAPPLEPSTAPYVVPLKLSNISKKREHITVPHGNVEVQFHADLNTFAVFNLLHPFDREKEQVGNAARPPTLKANVVMHHPVFQKLFADQVLSLQQSLSVEKVVLAFTDITDSTRQYERLGDGEALRMVRDHFDILFDVVEKRQGRMVKTVGDAVMCSFLNPGDCLVAMMEAVSRCAQYSQTDKCPKGGCVKLKIGMHQGPCMLVSLNNVNDYFGQTVNVAARVQGAAESNEIVLSDSIASDPIVQKLLKGITDSIPYTLNPRMLKMKGVTAEMSATSMFLVDNAIDKSLSVFDTAVPLCHETLEGHPFFLPQAMGDMVMGQK